MKINARAMHRRGRDHTAVRQLVNQRDIGGDRDVKMRAACRNWRDIEFHAPNFAGTSALRRVRRETAVLPNAETCFRDISTRIGEMRCVAHPELSLAYSRASAMATLSSPLHVWARNRRKIRGTFTAITSSRVQEARAFIRSGEKKFFGIVAKKNWHAIDAFPLKYFPRIFRIKTSVGRIIKFRLNSCNREILPRASNFCQYVIRAEVNTRLSAS